MKKIKKLISIIIPSYNEADSISELISLLIELKKKSNLNIEVIFIDDGSDDKTESIIGNQKNIKIFNLIYIKFFKNTGKTNALSEGINNSSGEIIATMDADLQDDPFEIPKLLKKIEEGYDFVVGKKYNRLDPLVSKKIPSFFFNFLIRFLFKIKISDINSGLKVFKKEIFNDQNLSNDFHRVMPLIAHINGYKVTEVPVNHKKRKYGKSKYGLMRIVNGINDMLYILYLKYFAIKPLHFYGLVGIFFSIISLSTISYLFFEWISGNSIGTRPLLMFSILSIITSIFSFMIGFLAQSNYENIALKRQFKYKKKIKKM